MPEYDTIIKRRYTLLNTTVIKAVNILVKLIAFSNDHYDLVKYDGKPLGRVRYSNENAFIIYSLKEMRPRETRHIGFLLYLKRKNRSVPNGALDIRIEELPTTLRKKVKNASYIYASRRVKKLVDRILRKTDNLLDVEWEILNFLKRNIKCNTGIEGDPEAIFYRSYGGPRELVFAFNTINMLMGIPARQVSGFVLKILRQNIVITRYVWSEIFTKYGWMPIDPCKGIFIDPNDKLWVPIKVEFLRGVKNVETNYKLIKKTLRKAIYIEEDDAEITIKTDEGMILSAKLESISP